MNIQFTKLIAGHAEFASSLWSDYEIVKFTNWAPVTTSGEVASRIARIGERYQGNTNRVGPYVVEYNTDGLVGMIGIDFVSDEHELWYIFQRRIWGQGVGGSVVSAFIRQMKPASIQRLVATAVADNIASWKILEKNAFTRSRAIPKGFDRNGLLATLYPYERKF